MLWLLPKNNTLGPTQHTSQLGPTPLDQAQQPFLTMATKTTSSHTHGQTLCPLETEPTTAMLSDWGHPQGWSSILPSAPRMLMKRNKPVRAKCTGGPCSHLGAELGLSRVMSSMEGLLTGQFASCPTSSPSLMLLLNQLKAAWLLPSRQQCSRLTLPMPTMPARMPQVSFEVIMACVFSVYGNSSA